MSGKSIKQILKEFGLADNQAKIYIFLAKYGVLKGGDIAKQIKMPKAVVYRTLKILQRKGFVESTLEFPARYIAVPFETVLDLNIKAKKEEALQIEKSKEDLLNDWKNISKGKTESSIEKFVVIDGDRKIFAKIYQMIKKTKKQLIAASTISDLFRADRFGVFDAVYDNPLKSKVKFRFLTDLTDSDLSTAKLFKNRLRSDLNFRGRNPELGISLFPRMVIRDNEEILLFISDKNKQTTKVENQSCLCTNCKSIIQSYSGVFEDLWQNSTDIKQKIKEIETGKLTIKTQIIKDPQAAEKLYKKSIITAKKEIMIITSSLDLNRLLKNKPNLQELANKGAKIKIMAPITGKNLDTSQQLLDFSEVKHISVGYQGTTIIDKNHLFQFRFPTGKKIIDYEKELFKNTIYTNDLKYISNSKKMFLKIWKKAQSPISKPLKLVVDPFINPKIIADKKKRDFYADLEGITKFKFKGINSFKDKKHLDELTEKDFLKMILQSQIKSDKKSSKDIIRQYGTSGRVIIHPPKSFGLPEMVFILFHFDKHSYFGAEDSLIIGVSCDMMDGSKFVPAALIGDNEKALVFLKNIMFKGLFPEKSFSLFNKDELQIRVHGNNLFCSWTKPINLLDEFELPPASILLQGYGDVRTRTFSVKYPSGYQMNQAGNYLESFVTFYHPISKYSGPGTDSIFDRDIFMEIKKIE